MSSYLHALHQAHCERLARLRMPVSRPVFVILSRPPPLSEAILEDPLPEPEPEPEPESAARNWLRARACIDTVCANYKRKGKRARRITARDIIGDKRRRDIMRPRHIAIYLTHQLTTYSLPRIGRIYHRDHTTILHAIRRIESLMCRDAEFAAEIEYLISQVPAAPPVPLQEGGMQP